MTYNLVNSKELLKEIKTLEDENKNLKSELKKLKGAKSINYKKNQALESNCGYSKDKKMVINFFENNKSIMLLIDPNTGIINYANQSACYFYGYEKDEFTGMNISQINIESNGFVNESMNNALVKKKNRFHFKHKLYDGVIKDVEVTSGPITIDNRKYLFSIVYDITEKNKNIMYLKKAHRELKQEKKTLKSILEGIEDGVLVLDNNSKVIYKNKAFNNIWKSSFQLLNEKDGWVLARELKKQLAEPNNFEDKIKDIIKSTASQVDYLLFKDGKMVERHFYPLIVEGKDKGMIWCFKDLTEKEKRKALEEKVKIKDRQLEEKAKYDQIKTQLFSNISHELKTPLNIILGGVQLLSNVYESSKDDNYSETLQRNLKVMKQNCYRLLRLINNIVDVTRFDSGFLKLNLNNHNIIHVIESIVLSIADFSKVKGIELIFDTEIEEKIIACDPEKIERIILNLLSNAIKFTKKGGSIYVNIYDKGDNVVISVRDTGIGIPKGKINGIFERFKQVNSNISRENEGSGIGLSLVQTLVEAHKGKISVESEEGVGTEFTIELPVNVIKKEKIIRRKQLIPRKGNVENIHIEFSDIYSVDLPIES
ncbi:PAS domain-containing sensor histidine kinase [Dethiothermospora halolimnae]|uniref:sensor histidine kinase n=1 Tax=Dethiothermospora halolimnae TaxID=3114390 RepID=UPI003CCBE6A6